MLCRKRPFCDTDRFSVTLNTALTPLVAAHGVIWIVT